jgi:dTDP-4-amino-4,6-dideoxygalactose transaminase
VITTPYTFFATAGCVARVGARPVFVDIDPETYNIDAGQIAAAVTARTRAIIPVHLFGQIADMDPIMEIAARHTLAVIEDAAQAIGSRYKGRPAGSFGTTGCFSFYPTKNLGTLGDGGMIVTQDMELAGRLRVLRDHGQSPQYYHKLIGGNFRMDTLHAAALLVKLPHLDRWSQMRRANAATYDRLLADVAGIVRPVIRDFNTTIYNQYIIRVDRRDELQAFLKENGIGSAIYYPVSLHEQECFAYLKHNRGDFPQSEGSAAHTLALPIFSELTDEQIAYVAGKVREFAG